MCTDCSAVVKGTAMCRQYFQAIKTTVAISEKEIGVRALLLSHNISRNA